jgi:hypothetical protein
MAWSDPAKIPPVIVAVSAERVRRRLDRRRGGARKAVIAFVVAIEAMVLVWSGDMLSAVIDEAL